MFLLCEPVGRKGVETDELAVRLLVLGRPCTRKKAFRVGEVLVFRIECSASGRTLDQVRGSSSSNSNNDNNNSIDSSNSNNSSNSNSSSSSSTPEPHR